jgi:processive 1,2-diacylglycerol beta-glucosyltransferase/1,2-diacylglycerol 3-beta-galactosyltransferase
MDKKKKKYLLVYLRTGGGHLAPARAVSNYLNNFKNEEVETVLVDAFEKSSKLPKYIIVDGYRILQSKAKWLYEIIYAIHKIKLVSEITSFLVSIFITKNLKEIILREQPDKIIIFHFFVIKPIYIIKNNLNLSLPVITVVTDPFTAHPLWFLRKEQSFIVFSKELKEKMIKNGIAEKNINVFPFILDEKFSRVATLEEVVLFKKQLGFTKDKVLLILGGGDGIPKGIPLLKNLLKIKGDFEIVIVCGRNIELLNKATKLKNEINDYKLKVYGYVDFIYQLISLSDIVITKCGASTFMETLISNKIPLVNSYLWEQEKGNVEYLVNNKLGIYEKDINKIPIIVNKLLSDKNLIKEYINKIQALSLTNGTKAVAEYINQF